VLEAEGVGPPEHESERCQRVEIDASIRDVTVLASHAWSALVRRNEPPRLFSQGGRLCRVVVDDRGNHSIHRLTKDDLTWELNRAAWFFSEQPTRPGRGARTLRVDGTIPKPLVNDLYADPKPPLPLLRRIVSTPIFDRQGRLHAKTAYQRQTSCYLDPGDLEMLPVSDNPSKEECDLARSLILDDVFCDFPWVGQSDRAHAMGLMFLPFVRDMIEGPTPGHLIEAPSPGSGKTILAQTALIPGLGTRWGTLPEAFTEEEWRKRITATLLHGSPAFVIDNVTQPLKSGVLSSAITAPIWTDRVLGASANVQLPVQVIWVATGNNPELSSEMSRRFIRIRIDPGVERPWQRNEFKHKLPLWAKQHRAELVWAALTLIRAWVNAGMRPFTESSLGGFEEWAFVIGGILEHHGIDGFLTNQDTFYETVDSDSAAWRDFTQQWRQKYEGRPVTSGELFGVAGMIEGFDLGSGSIQSQKVTFGKLLKKQDGMVYDGVRIEQDGRKQGTSMYRLRSQ
jgi:putative DNA primase/helicase